MIDIQRTGDPIHPRLRRTRPTIGLLVAGIVGGDQSGSLWSGVVNAASEQDVNLLCFVGDYLQDPQDFNAQGNIIYELVDKERIDGLIIWASSLGSYVGPDATKSFCDRYRPLPTVSVGIKLEGIPSIVLDSYQGMRDLVSHLIDVHGRRRLAFICGPEGHREARERYRAYVDVLKEHGLALDPALVSPPHRWGEQGGAEAVRLWLDQRKVRFDAVVAVNDTFAAGALDALHARGIHIPGDVALVGFSNDSVGRVVTPPLTTVPLWMYERGQRAIQIVLAMIAGEPVPQVISMPTRLIVRQSCGCTDPVVVRAAACQHPDQWTLEPQVAASTREPLAARFGQIHAEMRQAIEATAGDVRIEQLLNAFLAELDGAASNAFLSTLESILRQTSEVGGDVSGWQRTISLLRRCTLPHLTADVLALRAEDLWHQARVMISESARRLQGYLAWQANRQFGQLNRLGQLLATALDIPTMMDVLAHELPQLGITACYLSLYEDPQRPTEWARLVLAYDERGRIKRDAVGQHFPSRRLAPEGILPSDKPYNLLIQPLHFREEQLGFLVLDGVALQGHVYNLLRNQISSALKEVLLLVQNVELYHQALKAQQAAQAGQRRAEEADLLKSRFLSSVSHELLTPLVLLVGLSEMMLRGRSGNRPPLPESYRQDLERIHVGAQQLGNLVRDVLDLARSQMGRLKLARKPLDLGETLKAVALVGEQMARGKGLAWQVEIPERLPKVSGDPSRLQQVVLNLVTNAVKFTTRGQVKLKVEVGDGVVTVLVSDTGLGVPLAEQEAIFDEFRQSERTATRGYGGLGIGLAICRQLVELHDGQIGVRSSGEEEGGSTFYFTLPTISGQAAEEPSQKARSQTVLLLTERASSGARLQAYLTREGFQVELFYIDERPDWLSQVTALSPGTVVLDCQPASERGWQLIETLKENPGTQDLPVLFYSLAQEEDSGSMLALDYLTKPMGPAALTQALRRYGLENECRDQRVILVVDDDPAILDMHTQIVRTFLPDCRVLQASNGRMALEVMQRERPALVLLDLMMPELDGMGVLEVMQENESTRGIPVIVLTAQMLAQTDMARLNRGVASVLEKGLFTARETLEQIQQALARNKALGSETQRMVRKAMAYIHEHYAEPVSREDMASHIGVSARHLTRCFHQEVGISPITYLNRYRVKKARQLLEAGDKNITEVAQAVGFSSGNYFTNAFRREMGMSPRDYQRGQRF